MIERLILLLVFALFNSYLFSKKYKVAYIANSVLFVFLFVLNMFVVDHVPLVRFWINLMGEKYYYSLRGALDFACEITNISMGTLIVIQIVFFIIVPLVSVVAIVRQVRKDLKELETRRCILVESFKPDYDCSVQKEYLHNEHNSRLKYGVMQN